MISLSARGERLATPSNQVRDTSHFGAGFLVISAILELSERVLACATVLLKTTRRNRDVKAVKVATEIRRSAKVTSP